MLNATVDTDHLFGQVVKHLIIVLCIRLSALRMLGSQVTIIKIYVIIIAGNVIIQRCVCCCEVINSAKQSKHQLLVLLLKKFHPSFTLRATSYEVVSGCDLILCVLHGVCIVAFCIAFFIRFF
jgi:hypothetical protein